MPTGQELITSALRLINVVRSGQSPSTEESDDAFIVLNQLLASWSAQQVPCLGITRDTHTMNGSASYTIASGATISVARPLRIKSAAVVVAGMTIPFNVVPAEIWAQGRNFDLFYDGAYATGTIYLRPAPSSGTLELFSYKALTAIATLSTTINLPPGYERALRFALAIDLASEFGVEVPGSVAAAASESIGAIASLNRQVLGEMPPQQQVAA